MLSSYPKLNSFVFLSSLTVPAFFPVGFSFFYIKHILSQWSWLKDFWDYQVLHQGCCHGMIVVGPPSDFQDTMLHASIILKIVDLTLILI